MLSQHLSRPSDYIANNTTTTTSARSTIPRRSASPSLRRRRDVTPNEPRTRSRIRSLPPKFYTIPHNRIAEEGETVRFQCAIAGHPEPSSTWYKNAQIIIPSGRIHITERDDVRTLEIEDVKSDDSGIYKIILENDAGKIEASARLDVIPHRGFSMRGIRARSCSPGPVPNYRKYFMSSSARLGGAALFSNDLNNLSSPYVKWYKDGLPIDNCLKYAITTNDKACLQVNNVNNSDEGLYKCIIKDKNNLIINEGRLEIDDQNNNINSNGLLSDSSIEKLCHPPKIINELPNEKSVKEGSSVRLQVKVNASESIDVIWMKDGCVLPDCVDFKQGIEDDGIIFLQMSDVFAEDAGNYRCEIYTPYGEVMSKCKLTVEGMYINEDVII